MDTDAFVPVGRVVRLHGLKGDIVVRPAGDDPKDDWWRSSANAGYRQLKTAPFTVVEMKENPEAWDDLGTFGLRPSAPETGYGYIETTGTGPVLPVRAFREKPDPATALTYLESGRHYWNAGMFVWTLRDFRAQMGEHCPELLRSQLLQQQTRQNHQRLQPT